VIAAPPNEFGGVPERGGLFASDVSAQIVVPPNEFGGGLWRICLVGWRSLENSSCWVEVSGKSVLLGGGIRAFRLVY
jgi:hypothetical protein